MDCRRRGRRVPAFLLAACGMLAAAAVLPAQTATVPALTAAFLYNFAKFTEWPADALPPGEPLTLCIVSDKLVAEILADLTKGRSINGHALVVSSVAADAPGLAPCELAFAAGLDGARTSALQLATAGRPVLTVGDRERFAKDGGVIGLFVQDGTMHFAVNVEAAQRARLQLSSKLLTIARIVKGPRHANSR